MEKNLTPVTFSGEQFDALLGTIVSKEQFDAMMSTLLTKEDAKNFATKDDLNSAIDGLASIMTESFGEVYRRLDKNDADHKKFFASFAKNDADHEKFFASFAKNDADHEKFFASFAKNDADHEKFFASFAKNDADHAKNDADHAKNDADHARILETLAWNYEKIGVMGGLINNHETRIGRLELKQIGKDLKFKIS